MTNYGYDSEIADLAQKIFNNGSFSVDTINESLLVKLFELRGTPLKICETNRDIENDWENNCKTQLGHVIYRDSKQLNQ